jgi:hypothetical protein
MKHPLFPVFASVVIATIAQAEDRKITGTFESVRFDLLMGLPESITEKHKEAWEKSKQMIVITEKDLVLNVGLAGASGGIYMSYTTQGDFLLGKTVIGKSEMFYSVYIKDADTLFLSGQKFIRKQEAPK